MEKEKDEFNSLRIIYFALLIAQVSFMIVAYIAGKASTMPLEDQTAFLYASPILILLGHLMGTVAFNRLTTQDQILYSDKQPNLNAVRKAYIIRWALLEGPNLFALICFLITANVYFVYFFLIGIVLFLTLRPRKIWEGK